jgi:hypothetical protein
MTSVGAGDGDGDGDSDDDDDGEIDDGEESRKWGV